MTHEALTAAEPKMVRAVEAMERDFAAIRTGRASTALVERIPVDYYGTATPLNQIAGISTPDAHLIVIQPWDRSVLSAIEKAITKSDIGLMPNVDGTVVRLNVPPLTEERRKEMVKQVRTPRRGGAGRDPQSTAARRRTTSSGPCATVTCPRTRSTASLTTSSG